MLFEHRAQLPAEEPVRVSPYEEELALTALICNGHNFPRAARYLELTCDMPLANARAAIRAVKNHSPGT